MAEDTDPQQEQVPQQDPPLKGLWQKLHDAELTVKSYNDFQESYSTPDAIKGLHQKLFDAELTYKSPDDFSKEYFPTAKSNNDYGLTETGVPKAIALHPLALPSVVPPKANSPKDFAVAPPDIPNYAKGTDNTASVQAQQTFNHDDFVANNEERKTNHAALVNDAITNTAKKILKNKGIVKPEEDGKEMNLSQTAQLSTEKAKLQAAYKNGDVTFGISKDGEVGLNRTIGWWESLSKNWNSALNSADEAANFVNMPAEEKVAFLKKKQEENTHPEYLGERPNAAGSAGELIGSNAPFLIKGAEGAAMGAAAIAAAPESLGASLAGLPTAAAFMMTAPDMVNQGAMGEIQRRYDALKQQNPQGDDVELMKQAESGKWAGAFSGLLTDAALMGTGITMPISLEAKGVVGKAITKALTSSVHMGASVAAVDALKEAEGNLEGIKTTPEDIASHAGDSFAKNATVGLFLHTLTQAAMGAVSLPKVVSSAIKAGLKDVNLNEITDILKTNENHGALPQGVADKVLSDIISYKEADAKTIPGLSPDAQASVAGLIQSKDKLIAEQKTKDDSAKPYYEEKINGINEQIQKTINTGRPFSHEVDEMSGNTYKIPEQNDEPAKVIEPIQPDVTNPEGQGVKEAIPENPDGSGQGGAKPADAVQDDISHPIELSIEPSDVSHATLSPEENKAATDAPPDVTKTVESKGFDAGTLTHEKLEQLKSDGLFNSIFNQDDYTELKNYLDERQQNNREPASAGQQDTSPNQDQGTDNKG
jgi:hypothetical protein